MRSCIIATVAAAAGVAAAEPIRHVLVLGDESRGAIHYVDQFEPANSFSVPAPRPVWDLRVCGEGKYRSVSGKGFTVTDLKERKAVDTFSHDALGGLTSVCDLPDGGFIAGTNQRVDDKDAVVVYTFSADRQLKGKCVFRGIHYLRMMTRLPNGDVLLAWNDGILKGRLAAGGDGEGTALQMYKLPRDRNAYMAIPRKAGGYWVGGGFARQAYAYAEDGAILTTFEAKMPEGLKNNFYAGVVELANGNLIVANWNGHGAEDSKNGWQILEFDGEGACVWNLHDPVAYGSITGVIVIK
ncbi:MAG: hypothetical protein FWH21_05055 [Kiritimatiellaeota bacterium]|nr:hypothetical protein [Kiritimatiellota bacterium]